MVVCAKLQCLTNHTSCLVLVIVMVVIWAAIFLEQLTTSIWKISMISMPQFFVQTPVSPSRSPEEIQKSVQFLFFLSVKALIV